MDVTLADRFNYNHSKHSMLSKPPNPNIKRVEFALRSTGINLESANPLRSGTHSRGYLPHVKREGASYFVTFRLADSLPQEVLMEFQREWAEKKRRLTVLSGANQVASRARHSSELEEIDRDYHRKIERYLDRGRGECHLQRPEIADVAAGAIRHFRRAALSVERLGGDAESCSCRALAHAKSRVKRDYKELEGLHRPARKPDS